MAGSGDDNDVGTPSQQGPTAEPTTKLRIWVAVIGSTLGAFMAVLNIQIVNASLANIQGAIGAGIDEGGWISTAYLVAEIIVIPLTGWLARVFSVRRYLIVNAVLFLVFSASCGLAQNLGQMIVLRAIQGFTGGVLIPMSFTIIITLLPKTKQAVGIAMFAVSAIFAPAIGPTIGGYLTENWGWQFVFYVNVVPGVVMVAMLWFSLDASPMQLHLIKQGDWPGIVTLSLGLGVLQTVLEEGNKDDWFGSPFIVRLSVIASISLALFLWVELTSKRPLLNLRLILRRNFGFGMAASFLLGIGLYGLVFLLPQYLGRIQGYNSQQIGMVLAWIGLPQLVLIPLVPKLLRWFDPRLLIGIGLGLLALGNFLSITMTADYSADQLLLPNVLRAVGQALSFAPLSALATAGIEPENVGSASALFNMTRNLGGAIGIALLQTLLSKREQFHSHVINQSVSILDPEAHQRIDLLTNYFLKHGVSDPAVAMHKALIAIGAVIRQQAYIMAFSDCFLLLATALGLALAASLMLKKTDSVSGSGAH
jgi:DHA2 family multidrug resistance protein